MDGKRVTEVKFGDVSDLVTQKYDLFNVVFNPMIQKI
jgi:hypothetical protein